MTEFILPAYEGHSPASWYDKVSQQPNFIHDPSQKEAIHHLDILWKELVSFKEKRIKVFGKRLFTPTLPHGLYMWGSVGRGKSFLMDAFYNCLPYKRKRRVHFHAFMAKVHTRMKELKEESDPLMQVGREIATEVRVLCFDEFHVSDIADAMILGRLLEKLFQEGVVFLMTSNYKPDNLYPNGQNRASFIPTINLLINTLKVINIDGNQDLRLRMLNQADVFFQPDDEKNEHKMFRLFQQISSNQEILENVIAIFGRSIPLKAHSKNAVWLDFYTLCFTPRSQNDYLYLAKNYQYIFISHIEKLTSLQKNEARRLTWLIDVLYDYRVKTCMSSSVSINQIYTEGDYAEEFTRTASRMVEMQSEFYLKLPHLILSS